MKWLSRLRRKKKFQVVDLGDDPLDPHGDGTIRPGDPMFDAMMHMAKTGKALHATRREDGSWNVEELGD